jgi:catechol 2,3-dioxygenase-like lactoylglutathione lyase family enzyme
MAAVARIGHAQSRPRAAAVVALLAVVPLAADASGLLVSALLTALLAVLVVAEQSSKRWSHSSNTGPGRAPSLRASNFDNGRKETAMAEQDAPTIARTVPNIKSDRPADTRDFFTELLGFEVAMDLGWVATVASPTNPSAQVSIIGNDDPAAPGISIEVDDVDAIHARAAERGLEIAYPLRDEEWGVRRFMLREPSGTTVNVLSHRSD